MSNNIRDEILRIIYAKVIYIIDNIIEDTTNINMNSTYFKIRRIKWNIDIRIQRKSERVIIYE